MAAKIDGQFGSGARSATTSNAAAWRPGMTFISPVTGKRTTNAADVPGTAEYNARQVAAQTNRYTGGHSPVATYSGSGSTAKASSGTLGARSGPSAAQVAATAAANAAAAAQRAANGAARTGAVGNRNQLQQAIDAAVAQKQVNQGKLDALSGLVNGGLAKGRDTSLKGIDRDLRLLLDQAVKDFHVVVGDLNVGLRDNEKSEADASFNNLSNRARESGDVAAAAQSMGAGESDILRTQLQALRNWASNQGEVNRSYFDTLTSTNSSINDLNVGTKSTMTGYEMDANQRKGGIWQDFYQGAADAYTQMDTVAGNQYLLDREIAANKANAGQQDALIAHIDKGGNADAFKLQQVAAATGPGYDGAYAKQAAHWAGQTWENPGVSAKTAGFKGQETVVGQLNSSRAPDTQNGPKTERKKPEGATLRKW